MDLSSAESLSTQKGQIMEQVRAELAVANAQELLNKMNDKCFTKCVTKPGSRLDGGEQSCISKCMDRYMDAWNIVSKAYHGRIRDQVGAGGQGGEGMY
jgi:import inner membrane translocase subunit TIM13